MKNDNEQFLILGDFNAHHSYWNTNIVESKRGGQKLYNCIIESSLTLLNDGSFTRIPDRVNDSSTALDLSFISANLAPACQWMIQDDTLGSDHLPIIINIASAIVGKIEKDIELGFDTKKADWGLFNSLLHERIIMIQNKSYKDVQKKYDDFRKIVLEVAEISIPRKSNEFKIRYGNNWWNDECAIAVRDKKRAFHLYKRHECDETLETYKKAKHECRKIINNAKIIYLEQYLNQNIKNFKDARILWKKIRNIKNRTKLPEQPLIINGIKTQSNQEKADLLAETFAKNSQSIFLPESIKTFREKEEHNFETDNIPMNSELAINTSFSKTELMISIKQISDIKKATGSDLISYEMIKQFPDNAKEYLLQIYNECYCKGVIPNQWSNAEVKALPKKGKKQSDPNNYRPISLTPHLGKLYERLIKNRLEYFFEKNKIIPSNQAGFKRGRGCIDNTVKLSSSIKKHMSKGKPVLAVFFDIRKAYDSVWISKVLQKLKLSGITGEMFHAIKCLISNRNLQVRIGASKSKTHFLDMGVPQGSVLSPLIFNLMLSDINKVSLNNCDMTLYADDLTIWMSPSIYKNLYKKKVCSNASKRLQENVDKIVAYMNKSGFQLSPEKTTLVVFSGRHKIDKEKIFINMNGKKIYPSDSAKYLGVTFDRKLNWKNHITDIINKTDMVWSILKALKSTPGGNHIPNLLMVVKSLVRSKLCYGQEVYFSASKDVLKSLQIKECHFLRYVLGLAPGTPQDVVYHEAGWLPLEYERELRCAQYFHRSQLVENYTNEELKEEYDNIFFNKDQPQPENNKNSVQRCVPFHYYVHEINSKSGLNNIDINKIPTSPIPPWLLEECVIDKDYANDYNKQDNQLFITMLAKERIESKYKNHLHVYTDGSKQSNGDVGCAFNIPYLNIEKGYKLNKGISIFSAELYALYMALTYIKDFPKTLTQVVLLSDSKSVLESLNNTKSKNRADLIMECKIIIHQIICSGTELVLMWIPSHTGIRGNEKVDLLAKQASSKNMIDYDIGYSLSEIYSKLKDTALDKWKCHYKEESIKRNWNNFDSYVYPNFNSNFHPLFHRLRARYTKFHYQKIDCICNHPLQYNHIFTCSEIIPKCDKLVEVLRKEKIQPSPENLLTLNSDYGWYISEVFIQCLNKSEISKKL